MKIFIASLVTETNTFSPLPTGIEQFEEYGIFDGDVTSRAPEAMHGVVLAAWRGLAENDGHEVVEGLSAFAQPSGRVKRAVYEGLRDRILQGVAGAMPLNVVLLNLHGAMAADGYDDCEGDLITRMRAIVGPGAVIGVELDLHCHLTQAMVDGADLLIAYKEYPHRDMTERAEEIYRLAMRAAAGEVRPVTSSFDCRMIGLWPTGAEPMASFVRRLAEAERDPDILSVSLGHGFPWGDVADVGAKLWVIADGDPGRAAEFVERLGRAFVALREDIGAKFLDVYEALDLAHRARSGPVVLADVADNPGGGAPGNSSFILRRLLELGERGVVTGCYWHPEEAAACARAGPGAKLELSIGGQYGAVSGEPVRIEAVVKAIVPDHSQAALSGSRLPLGLSAWVEADGIDIVLCSIRNQTFAPDAFTGMGIPLKERRIVVVKSTEHFRAAFAPIACEILYVSTPGAISPDFASIPYTKRDDRFWPRVFDPFGSVEQQAKEQAR